MQELVTVTNGEAVTSTVIIAEGSQNGHKAVIQLVRKYQKDLEEVGQRVTFQMAPFETDGGVQNREIALLNEPQTTLLFTFMQNTEIVRGFKVKLIKAFYQMRDTLQFQGAGGEQFDFETSLTATDYKGSTAVFNLPAWTLFCDAFAAHKNAPEKSAAQVKIARTVGHSDCWLRHTSSEVMPVAGTLQFESMLNSSPAFNKLLEGVVNIGETVLPLINNPRKVMNTTTVQEFLTSQCYLEQDTYCTKNALHKAFTAWCDATGAGMESKPNFFAKLYRCHPTISQGRILVDGVRTHIVTGVAVETN